MKEFEERCVVFMEWTLHREVTEGVKGGGISKLSGALYVILK